MSELDDLESLAIEPDQTRRSLAQLKAKALGKHDGYLAMRKRAAFANGKKCYLTKETRKLKGLLTGG